MTLGERIKTVRGQLSQADFAKRVGIGQRALSYYEKDERTPDATVLENICAGFGVSAQWLLLGGGEMAHNVEAPISISPCDPDLYLVPMVEARLSAGNGSLETSGEEIGRYAFRKKFLARKGGLTGMVLMRVFGDSMEPEIKEGDVVLIDQGQVAIYAGRIYAVGVDEEVVIKVLDKTPGKLILRSLNPTYAPIEINLSDEAQQVRIIGRVVWWCREAR